MAPSFSSSRLTVPRLAAAHAPAGTRTVTTRSRGLLFRRSVKRNFAFVGIKSVAFALYQHTVISMQALSSATFVTPDDSRDGPYDAAMRKSDLSRERPPMSQRLVELRQRAGLTQPELAAAVGGAVSNIAFWELKGTPPRGEVLPKMAQALGVSVDELLGAAPGNPEYEASAIK